MFSKHAGLQKDMLVSLEDGVQVEIRPGCGALSPGQKGDYVKKHGPSHGRSDKIGCNPAFAVGAKDVAALG